MDSIIAQHSCLQALLIFCDVKDYFNSAENELFFLNEPIYGEDFAVILKGKKEGLEIGYYKSGGKLYEVNYKDNKLEGLCIRYYNSGEKEGELNYKAGKREGLTIRYYKSGRKHYETNYKNGREDGLEVWYSESGEKKYKKEWKEGKRIDKIKY